MIKYQIDKSGLNQLTIKLSKVRNLQPVLKEIGQNLEASTKNRFNQGKDPENNKWKPSKRVLRQGKGRTLVETGRLQKSISYRADKYEVNVGTDIEYADKHQDGLEGLPKRSFLGISDKDRTKIENIVRRFLDAIF